MIFKENYQSLIDSELVLEVDTLNYINFLREKNLKIGLVSSASSWMVEKVLSKLNLAGVFDTVITNADTTKHKPDPEAYLLALDKLKLASQEVIAFEDSEAGIHAANAASIRVFGRRHSFNETHDFEKCDNEFSSFSECLGWELF